MTLLLHNFCDDDDPDDSLAFLISSSIINVTSEYLSMSEVIKTMTRDVCHLCASHFELYMRFQLFFH